MLHPAEVPAQSHKLSTWSQTSFCGQLLRPMHTSMLRGDDSWCAHEWQGTWRDMQRSDATWVIQALTIICDKDEPCRSHIQAANSEQAWGHSIGVLMPCFPAVPPLLHATHMCLMSMAQSAKTCACLLLCLHRSMTAVSEQAMHSAPRLQPVSLKVQG